MPNQLAFYTSQEIIRQRYNERHSGKISATKAKSIAIHVDQGINFFESAERADVTVKPLLQFYGVAALTRAIVMYLTPNNDGEKQFAGQHGLTVTDWAALDSPSPHVGGVELTIGAGLFSSLMKVTEGNVPFRANGSQVDWRVGLDSFPIGSKLNFSGMMMLIPEIHEELVALGYKIPKYARISAIKFNDIGGTKLVRWDLTGITEADVEKFFTDKTKIESVSLPNGIIVTTGDSPVFQPIQNFDGPFNLGEVYLFPLLRPESSISPAAIYYANSYVLSMLARYRLSQWISIWRGGKGDAARPAFEKLMGGIQVNFPTICADLFSSK